MKRNIITLSLMLAFAMVSVALAQEPTKKQASKKATVQVVSIDAANNTISVKDASGANMILSVSPQTKITKEGKTIAIGDLKANDNLSVEYHDDGGKLTAKSVVVTMGKG
jgi:hypothetical protein